MIPQNYEYISRFLLERSALSLGAGKEYLLDSRLMPVAKAHGLSSLDELIDKLRTHKNSQLETFVVEAMTTNETLFFRDNTPFEELASTFIPEISQLRQSQKSLRIWCAACSTGQEPYSILMLLHDKFPQLVANWNIELLCTDLDNQVLKRAQEGVYTSFEVQRGLSAQLRQKYFDPDGSNWKIKESLKKCMTFKQLNLVKDYGAIGQFDIVFCRNVLIYFEPQTKKTILERIARHIQPHGLLFLGAAETVLGITQEFQRTGGTRSAVYQLASYSRHKPANALTAHCSM